MEINIPGIVAEVRVAFERYERALVGNDVAELNSLFWDSPNTLRYGGGENLRGHAAIAAFRGGRATGDLTRDLAETVITTFGRDAATASTLFRRRATGRTGRQMQTWIRMADGWRVVAAHVSLLDFPFPD